MTKPKVLVATWDKSLTSVYSRILEGDYDVTAVDNPEELEKLRTGEFNIAFVDLDLPNSLETIAQMSIPTIATSDDRSQKYLAREAGANYFLQRPFENIRDVRLSILKARARYALNTFEEINSQPVA